jgi:hypothetical protein
MDANECFEIKSVPNAGLGWYATRDVDQGEIIYIEDAAAVGPSQPNSCLECLR